MFCFIASLVFWCLWVIPIGTKRVIHKQLSTEYTLKQIVWSYKAGQDKKRKNNGTMKVGEISTKVQELEVEVVYAFDEKGGAQCRN